MKLQRDDTWMRRGLSLLWDAGALARVTDPRAVLSLRQLFTLTSWPEDLPGTGGDALVVAGLEGLLDTLSPEDAEVWLENDLRHRILDFQNEYEGTAALVFWLPSGRRRITMRHASEEYFWKPSPAREPYVPLGRHLWAGAEPDVARILVSEESDPDPDGDAYVGLYHPRLS